jgi:polysaccharide transporter, PST family
VPYVVRVLGPGNFGLVNFAAAFAGFFVIIGDYGFNFSANRDIARNRQDEEKCREIYNTVFVLKLSLFLLCLLIFIPVIYIFSEFFHQKIIFFISLGTLLGNVLFPYWLFKGMEKMMYIAVPNIIIRTITTLLIFILVLKRDDVVTYAVILNAGNVILGIAGVLIVAVKYRYRFYVPAISTLKDNFKEGLEVFYSIICTSIYNYANIFLLGIFTDYRIVGVYSAADKIITGITGLVSNLNESTYPRISSLLAESRKSGVEMIKTSAKIIGAVSLTAAAITFVFAESIVRIVFGAEFSETVIPLRILSFVPLFLSLNNLYGVQTILNMGYKREFLNIILISLFYFLIASFILVPMFMAVGTSLSIASTELVVLLLMIIFVKKKKLLSEI